MDAILDERERQLALHLARAGELLRQEHIEQAEAEVQSALDLAPEDVRARNLYGLVRFRSGRYDDALGVFQRLVEADPADPSLRLNLGLVELRMGRFRDAAGDFEKVVAREPSNRKAHGYLGLALLRSGELVRARRAFLDAGQDDLARQVDERMQNLADDNERKVSEVRRSAEAGLKKVEEQSVPFTPIPVDEPPPPPASRPAAHDAAPTDELPTMSTTELHRASGAWQLRAPGAPPPTPATVEGSLFQGAVPQLKLEAATGLGEFAARRLLTTSLAGEPFALAENGLLLLRVDGRLPTRTLGAIASSAALTYEPLFRRVRGVVTDQPFGEGLDAINVAMGRGTIVVSPDGGHFSLLALRDDVLYVREPHLYAFEESLRWETGRVPGSDGDTLAVAQFRGHGRCVVKTRKAPVCVRVEGEALYVNQSALVGWIGRVVPRQLRAEDGSPTPYVECLGEGSVLLEEPASP